MGQNTESPQQSADPGTKAPPKPLIQWARENHVPCVLAAYLLIMFAGTTAALLCLWSTATKEARECVGKPPAGRPAPATRPAEPAPPRPSDANDKVEKPKAAASPSPAFQVPGSQPATPDNTPLAPHITWEGFVRHQVSVLGLVLVLGAMGGVLYGLFGLCLHLALDDFETKWAAWYVVRPAVGAGMALFIFLATRGGFITYGRDIQGFDLYATAALAGLCGMFSEQVSKKLAEVFATLFRTEKDTRRRAGELAQENQDLLRRIQSPPRSQPPEDGADNEK